MSRDIKFRAWDTLKWKLRIMLSYFGAGDPLNKLVVTNTKHGKFLPYTRRKT